MGPASRTDPIPVPNNLDIKGRRWRKVRNGKSYVVSCRQLWRARNQGSVLAPRQCLVGSQQATRPTCPPRMTAWRGPPASAIWSRDFSKLDDDGRREAVKRLLGTGAYDSLKVTGGHPARGHGNAVARTAPSPPRSKAGGTAAAASAIRADERGPVRRLLPEDRPSSTWIGPGTAIDAIDEARLEGVFHPPDRKGRAGAYSPHYAHTLLMTAKQFIRRLAAS